MDTKEKSYRLVEFSKKLRYRQDIIFSDEGNLNSLDAFKNVPQYTESKSKPDGLWFSHGRSWIGFLDNSYAWGQKRMGNISHVYRIYLSKSVLRIDTEKEFKAFEKEYATKSRGGIFWNRVAKHYDGVSLQYFYRIEDSGKSPWYYGWDLSSGCVWHRNGVRGIKLLKSWEVKWVEK
jgi:hypothetical protein